jgi:hypothetical protein
MSVFRFVTSIQQTLKVWRPLSPLVTVMPRQKLQNCTYDSRFDLEISNNFPTPLSTLTPKRVSDSTSGFWKRKNWKSTVWHFDEKESLGISLWLKRSLSVLAEETSERNTETADGSLQTHDYRTKRKMSTSTLLATKTWSWHLPDTNHCKNL